MPDNELPMQDLSRFRMPRGFRGRSALVVQLWWLVQSTLFRWSPQFAYPFRASLLRLFGANIGIRTVIRPTATFTYPWKISIGDYSWIGDDVVIYSLDEVSIGANTVISQRSYLCAGDHDYKDPTFPIRGRSIRVGSGCWLATDTFVAPGVSIGENAVVGARSSVFSNLPADAICTGSPCRKVRNRMDAQE